MELKPCPFCGGEAHVFKLHDWWVSHGCEVLGRYLDTHSFGTEAEAISAWNTRAERTCEVLGEDYDELLEYWETELSCGHVFDGMAKYVNYCPECGAKLVSKGKVVSE